MNCLYCGGVKRLGTEHLVPRTRGGLNIPENLFKACGSCNSSKSDRLPSEWRSDLSPEIYELERRALILQKLLPRPRSIRPLKEAVFSVRCTESQREILEEIASSKGMGLSTWVLHTALVTAETKEARR